MKTGALGDITILDLSRVLCGPYGMMLLADMGADVIKVENPDGGDDTRAWGPFNNDESLYFASINRNKRSATLNLKTEEGKALFKEMVKKADVVLENFRPGVMDKLGLGYSELSKINERIIYAAVSGFGSYGPYSQQPGYDIIAQAMGGIMSVTGFKDGPPTRVGASIGDIMGGLNIVIGMLAAINERHTTGKGQYVEVSLVDSILSSVSTCLVPYFHDGKITERLGNRSAAIAPYDSFKAKDGDFIIGCGNQKLYELLCAKVINRPDLIDDVRFKTMPDRAKNEKILKEYIEEWTTQQTVEGAVLIINGAGIPAAPIYNAAQIEADEHIANVKEMVVPLEHPTIGKMKVIGNPIKLGCVKPKEWKAAPLLGENNEEVYQQLLGLDKQKVLDLREKGII